jgi:hypothetical protein
VGGVVRTGGVGCTVGAVQVELGSGESRIGAVHCCSISTSLFLLYLVLLVITNYAKKCYKIFKNFKKSLENVTSLLKVS